MVLGRPSRDGGGDGVAESEAAGRARVLILVGVENKVLEKIK